MEVSGWDVAESFFVEKVSLELTQAGERVVHLKHSLREGLIVFLRLMESRITFPVLRVAYRVTEVSPSERDGVNRVSLRKLRHRRPSDSETAAPDTIELL
ncbi:MAG TPA: hypothetical protein VNJ12_03540 [Candidatus Dormibacteraeota bacterium]|nr:hypothetical protein [Candidatus Dormibacteraeota bacterium]